MNWKVDIEFFELASWLLKWSINHLNLSDLFATEMIYLYLIEFSISLSGDYSLKLKSRLRQEQFDNNKYEAG